MVDSNLLIHFKINKGTFFCYGDVSVCNKELLNGTSYPIFEVTNVTAKKLNEAGESVSYVPTETTFMYDYRYRVEDMITSVVSILIINGNGCEVYYIHPKLQEVVDFYKKDCIKVGDISVPKYVLRNGNRIYKLTMGTDMYVYYNIDYYYSEYDSSEYYSEYRPFKCPFEWGMYSCWEHNAMVYVAEKDFAKFGFFKSIVDIKNGKEKLLFLADGWRLEDYEVKANNAVNRITGYEDYDFGNFALALIRENKKFDTSSVDEWIYEAMRDFNVE